LTPYVGSPTLLARFRYYGNSWDWYAQVDDVTLNCTPSNIFVDDDYDNSTQGWGVTHFDSIQNGVNAAQPGATVFVAAGTYNESATVDKAITVQVQGAISLSGTLDLLLGTFNAPAANMDVGGDFIRRSASTFNANGGTITFNGGVLQNLTLDSATTFNNLVVGSGSTLVETNPTDNTSVAGTMTNNGTIRKSQSISGAATYTFGLLGSTIVVNNDGSGSLTSIQIDSIDQNQPNATYANVQTGRYWDITANGGAAGFNVDMTMPVTFVPAVDGTDKLCRYTGTGTYPFECGLQTENSGDAGAQTLTRQNITQFSSWTAGTSISPTAVTLQQFSSITNPTGWALLLVTGILGLFTLVFITTRRRKQT
jgi:hypothetical protein